MKSQVNKMTGKKLTYAVDAAKSPISNYGIKYTPQLLLACPAPGNKVQMALDIGSSVISGDIINNIHPVNIRFDKNPEFGWRVSASTNGNGYYFNNPAALLTKDSKAKQMLVQFTTMPTSQNVVVDFDISGMGDVLKKMQCHS